MSFTQPVAMDNTSLVGSTSIIKLSLIDPSPFNPRKEFDKVEIDELGEAIKTQGLLQNLIVRPKKGGRFELMGGERRFRALKKISAAEAKCNVIEADDGQALAVQIVENLQRQDLKPLEEAEAFAQLQKQDPVKWTAQEIAKAIGKTDRFVQQRIAIAKGLSAPLKEKFGEGALTIEAARTLATMPAEVQKQIPDWAIQRSDVDDIRKQALEICIPETAAKFDVATYKGEWIEDGKGKKYFADLAQFMKLQKPAAEKKLAEVVVDWPGAQIITDEEAGKLYWADEHYVGGEWDTIRKRARDNDKPAKFAVPREKCRAVIWIAANGQIRKALGVCTANAVSAAATKRQAVSSSPSRMKSPASETADHKKERVAFNVAISKAAAKDPAFVERLLIFNVLNDSYNHGASQNEVDKLLPAAVAKARPTGWGQDRDKSIIASWQSIAEMTAAQARITARALLLADVPLWEDHDHREKPHLQVAMAKSLGVTPPAIALPEPPKVKAAAGVKVKSKKPAAKKKAARK